MPFPPSPPAPEPVERTPVADTEGGSWARVDEWLPGPLGENYQEQPDGGSWARIDAFRPTGRSGIHFDGMVIGGGGVAV